MNIKLTILIFLCGIGLGISFGLDIAIFLYKKRMDSQVKKRMMVHGGKGYAVIDWNENWHIDKL